jgi:hypothetical protein
LGIPDGLPLVILSRRLSNLLDLKGPFNVDLGTGDLLKMYQEEAERQRREMEKWKLRSELLLQLAGNPAGEGLEVDSELSSERSSIISFSTGFSEFGNDIGNLEDIEQVLLSISEEELEKHFYGLCVRAKMSLPKGHPGHDVPISKIYLKVQSEGIPISQWKDYLSKTIGNLN